MIIVKLKDQLGNQMFAYASIKSIAMDKNMKFGFFRVPLSEEFINDSDERYGNDLYTIFNLPESEWVKELPDNYDIYKELPMKERNDDGYAAKVRGSLIDNLIADGHFITTVFIADKVPQLREWFRIPFDVEEKIKSLIQNLRGKNTLISVHFRVGDDYVRNGFKLKYLYWQKAAQHVKSHVENPRFICVYDKRTKEIERFIKEFDAVEFYGSLVEDMCLISKCDGNIVCNSTFSIMAALLNEYSQITICPGKYPTEAGYLPDNVFLEEWIHIGKGKRDFKSWLYYIRRRYLRKSKLLKLFKNT